MPEKRSVSEKTAATNVAKIATKIAAILAVASVSLLAACAGTPAKLTANESIEKIPVRVAVDNGDHRTGELVVTVFTPSGSGRHPLIVINHGRAGDAAGRARLGRARYIAASRFFARAGFVVAVPVRMGYGATGGPDLEDTGTCHNRHFTSMFDRAASQIEQVIDQMKRRPDVDPSNVVILGQSAGGGSTVAAAALNLPGVKAAINFAGGAAGDPVKSPAKPCDPDGLQQAYVDYGRVTHVPMLWIYTENDLYWGPEWPRKWAAAYNQAGGHATFVHLGPDGENGHNLFTHSPGKWKPLVADFLRKQGFSVPDGE